MTFWRCSWFPDDASCDFDHPQIYPLTPAAEWHQRLNDGLSLNLVGIYVPLKINCVLTHQLRWIKLSEHFYQLLLSRLGCGRSVLLNIYRISLYDSGNVLFCFLFLVGCLALMHGAESCKFWLVLSPVIELLVMLLSRNNSLAHLF